MIQYFKDDSVDCVFVDGDHTYVNAKLDMELWYPKLHKGGLMVLDDVSDQFMGVVQALDEFSSKYNLQVRRVNGHGNYYVEIT